MLYTWNKYSVIGQLYFSKKAEWSLPQARGRGGWEIIVSGYKVSVLYVEKSYGYGWWWWLHNTVNVFDATVHLEMLKWQILYIFYHNKKIGRKEVLNCTKPHLKKLVLGE